MISVIILHVVATLILYTLLREIYIESKGKVMVTLLSDPKANAINFSLQPRQKNNKKKQKPTSQVKR